MPSAKPMSLWSLAVGMAKKEVTKDAYELRLLSKRIYCEMRRAVRLRDAQKEAAPQVQKKTTSQTVGAFSRGLASSKRVAAPVSTTSRIMKAMRVSKATVVPARAMRGMKVPAAPKANVAPAPAAATPKTAMKVAAAPSASGGMHSPKSLWARASEMARQEDTRDAHERSLLTKRIYCEMRKAVRLAAGSTASSAQPAAKSKTMKTIPFQAATVKVQKSMKR
eukprot:TRINITY_DN7796_c0_g1_i2.p1 TRINITY_DN7796_c0_g1~~TRINITY_DN7796_c0_g1_i2.p1  ORF type:complete len:243 (-),score=37.53 TRINITY_DN7796_c0_g1_i2:308-973(-)